MSDNKVFLVKIVQHLNDPSNEILRNDIEIWRNSAGENEEFFQQINELWNVSSELRSLDLLNTEDAVERLSARLGYDTYKRRSPWLGAWNIAAAILLLVLGFWTYSFFTRVNYITRTTGSLIDSVKLEDGSKVYLSENTAFRYPEKMKGDIRQVFLIRGSAFFNVAEDGKHPFVVTVDSSRVTVLGTSFNIKSEKEQIELAVRTGKIKFEAPNGNETSILTAGDGLIYSKRSGKTNHFVDGTGSDYAWLTHELKFVDTSLPEVFLSLEKYYKVKFRFEDSLSSYNKFNASFKDNKLDEVLEILKETYPLQITRRDSLVIVKSK